MTMREASHLVVAAMLAVTALMLAGCEGAGPPPGPPPGPAGTATIDGEVVSATDPATAVDGAVVSVRTRQAGPPGIPTGAQGEFEIQGVPGGALFVDVTMPVGGQYHDTTVPVETEIGKTTWLVVALVPAGLPQPHELVIAPRDTAIQTGVTRNFNAQVRDASGAELPVEPSWTLAGDIANPDETPGNLIDDDGNGVVDDGTIDRFGRYTAIKTTVPVTGQIFAASGNATDAVNVTVNPPGAPIVSQFVATPSALRPDGGTVVISAEVEDGDGIGDVGTPPNVVKLPPIPPGTIPLPPGYDGAADIIANVQPRGSSTVEQILLPLSTGTNKLGYYEASYVIPPNSNPTLPNGTQPPQVYDIYLTAVDVFGVETDSAPLAVVVEGVQGPPLPP